MSTDSLVNNKRIAKNTFFLYVRMLLLLFITLFTSRVVLDKLGIEDFGVYNVVGGLATMFTFFSSSLANATQRFLNIELGTGNLVGVNKVFNQHLILYGLICLFIIIASETIGLWFIHNKLVIPEHRMFAATCIFQFTVVSLCVTLVGIVFNSEIIAHEDMGVYSSIGIFEGLAKLAIAYILSISSSDRLIVYGLLIMLVTIVVQGYYAVYGFTHYEECKLHWIWEKKLLKKTSSILGWNTVGTAVYAINDSGINILLNIFFGPAVNAARAISYQINTAINNFATNFFTSVRPQIVKSYAKSDHEYLLKLFYRSSKYSFFLLWIFCLPISVSIHQILDLWLKEVPEYSDIFTIWVLAYSLVNVLNTPIWSVALAVGELKKYISIGSSVFLMIFPISYFALKQGSSPVAVFMIMFFVRLVYVYVVLRIIQKYVPISLHNYYIEVIQPIVKIAPVSLLLVGVVYYLLPHNVPFLLVFLMVSVGLTFTILWILGLNRDEKKFVCQIIKRRVQR